MNYLSNQEGSKHGVVEYLFTIIISKLFSFMNFISKKPLSTEKIVCSYYPPALGLVYK